jgi:hypothetical protein
MSYAAPHTFTDGEHMRARTTGSILVLLVIGARRRKATLV